MSKFTVFIIQSRVGSSLNLPFEELAKEHNANLVLIADRTVLDEIENRNWGGFFVGSVEVGTAFEYQNVLEKMEEYLEQSDLKGPEDYAIVTSNESKVSLCGRLRVHFGHSDINLDHFVFKDQMKDFAVKHDIKVPAFFSIDKEQCVNDTEAFVHRVEKEIGFPAFIKPLNMFAAKFCTKIENTDDLIRWVSSSTDIDQDLEFEIESFVDAPLYLCDALMYNGEIKYQQICLYSRPCNDIHTNPTLGWITISENDPHFAAMDDFCTKINSSFMANTSGVTHLEFFLKDGEPIFLEIAYRPNGVIPDELHTARAGIPMRTAHFTSQLKNPVIYEPKLSEYGVTMIFNYPQEPATLKSIEMCELNSEYDVSWYCKPGDDLPTNSGFDGYGGVAMVHNTDFEKLQEDFRRFEGFTPFILES